MKVKVYVGIAVLICTLFLLIVSGMGTKFSQYLYLRGFERNIQQSTRAIHSAHNDSERANAYARRGRAQSEKARYAGSMKIFTSSEYGQIFDLSFIDHEQSLKVNPDNAELHFHFGRSYYDRATVEPGKVDRSWLEKAIREFETATKKDHRNPLAWDMLGISYEGLEKYDEAILAFTQEMELTPYGRARLADAFCNRGFVNLKTEKYDASISDFENSIAFGSTEDGCSCEPFNPLLSIYSNQTHQYDKAQVVVEKAKKLGKYIAPEVIKSLKENLGR